jgi:hypothetical protein
MYVNGMYIRKVVLRGFIFSGKKIKKSLSKTERLYIQHFMH